MEEYLNIKEAAKFLGVHTTTLIRYCKQGFISYYVIGVVKRFKKEDLKTFKEGVKYNAGNIEKPHVRKDPFSIA